MRGALACLDDREVRAHKDLELLVGGGPSSVEQVRIGHASASGLSGPSNSAHGGAQLLDRVLEIVNDHAHLEQRQHRGHTKTC
jgi:hypothetical protein